MDDTLVIEYQPTQDTPSTSFANQSDQELTSDGEPVLIYSTPKDTDTPKKLIVKTTSLTKRRHDSESADDSDRGRPVSKKIPKDARTSTSVSTGRQPLNKINKIRPLVAFTPSSHQTYSSARTPSPLRQRSPHKYRSSSSQPNPSLINLSNNNNKNTLPKNDQVKEVVLFKIGQLSFNFSGPLRVKKEMSFLSKVKHGKIIHPKTLLEFLIIKGFNFHEVQDSQQEYEYGVTEYEKLTALLLFYCVSQEEETIHQWPTHLQPLPTTIAENWKNNCNQFKQQNVNNHLWANGPPDIDKHIAVANDLLQPSKVQSESLRTIARKRSSEDKKSKQLIKFNPLKQ